VVGLSAPDHRANEKMQRFLSYAETLRDFGSVLEQVSHGVEVMILRKGRPVAIVSPAKPLGGRPLSECIALLPENLTATIDDDFATCVEAAIESYRGPFDPPKSD
jgi:antitoxin (DNA-binding transcriptional repressor) of toxin-antitoxin stability system